jgi:dTMP kinase
MSGGVVRPGFFITLEGPDGSGKSTQANLLGSALAAAGFACTVTREPGGTRLGEAVREILLHSADLAFGPVADALLFSAARAQHVAEVIGPALARGDVVVCDRFLDSTLVYQGYAAGLPLESLRELGRFAVGGLAPDMTVLVDLPVDLGLGRKTGIEVTRFEERHDIDFHRRVREGFLALARSEPGRFAVVDGSRPVETVAADILAAVLPRLADWSGPAPRRRPADEPSERASAESEPEPPPLRIER